MSVCLDKSLFRLFLVELCLLISAFAPLVLCLKNFILKVKLPLKILLQDWVSLHQTFLILNLLLTRSFDYLLPLRVICELTN
jgi:hypothetical protein